MVNSELSKLLKETFKLSLYEAKAYQSVIEGAKQPKYISNRAGVPVPRIYDTLKSLEEKGFIRRDNNSYFAVEPNIALEGRIVQFKHEFESELKKQWKVKEIITNLKKPYGRGGFGQGKPDDSMYLKDLQRNRILKKTDLILDKLGDMEQIVHLLVEQLQKLK